MLSEFITQGYELENLKPYEDFLIKCSKKDYSGQGTQRHHILPESMGGSYNESNLITLNYQDHYLSHIILAQCFDSGTEERWKNTSSAGMIYGGVKRLLKKKFGKDFDFLTIDFWKEASENLSDLLSGENNHFYGKTHSNEFKKIQSIRMKGKYAGEKNPMFGKTHTPETKKIIGEKSSRFVFSQESRDKMSKSHLDFMETPEGELFRQRCSDRNTGSGNAMFGKKHTDETKRKMSEKALGRKIPPKSPDNVLKVITTRRNNGKPWCSEETKRKISEANKGKKVHNSKQCSINGHIFESIASASRNLGVGEWSIRNRIKSNKEIWSEWKYV